MQTTEPTPRSCWQIFDINDCCLSPCEDMPHIHRHPNDLAPAVKHLVAEGRDVCIRPVPFTAAMAVTAITKGASPRDIQRLTSWPDNEMAVVCQAAGARIRAGI